jgi:DNA-binding winged helix-turn-helix (wHTH) protein/Tfp pilus assembly protein PilF
MHPTVAPNAVLRFGVFEADLRSGELRKNGIKIKIQELPFRALKLLLSRPNEVISRDQLRQALWSDGVFVDFDHGISSAINRLRDALGDSADNPLFIETVERRGYRWIAPTHFPGPLAVPAQSSAPLSQPVSTPATFQPAVTSLRSSLRYVVPLFILFLAALILRPSPFPPLPRGAKAGNLSLVVAAPSVTRTANAEAEDFYLRGRYYWNKRTPEDLNKAIDFFTQSIVHDPNYAPAYVGLADTYNLMREYTLMPSTEAYPRALAAAKKAVELDDRSSAAHASVAFASFYGMWDAATAGKEFQRALELNPDNATAHHWYATYLLTMRRFPEALAEIERARALDPASNAVLADEGLILFLTGRRQEAITLLKQIEITEPKFVSPHRYLKIAYFQLGDFPNYIAELKKESTLLHDNATVQEASAAEKGFAAGGIRGMLENIWQVQKKSYDQGQASPYCLAQTSALLGKKQEALQYLKTSYDRHEERLIVVDSDPAFATLHDDPAYRDLTARINIPPR